MFFLWIKYPILKIYWKLFFYHSKCKGYWSFLAHFQFFNNVFIFISLISILIFQTCIDIFPICCPSFYIRSIPGSLCLHTWGELSLFLKKKYQVALYFFSDFIYLISALLNSYYKWRRLVIYLMLRNQPW